MTVPRSEIRGRLKWERICLQSRRPGFDPWVGKIPWRRERLPLQYSGLENSMDWIDHGVTEELDTTERLSLSLFCVLSNYAMLPLTITQFVKCNIDKL